MKEYHILVKGGMSIVYKVMDIDTKEEFALKILKKSFINSSYRKRQLDKEIKIHKKLDHPNIVKFIFNFEDNENIYILLELCEKKDIYKQIFDIGDIKSYMKQIISGLEYIHKEGIVHKDLKLQNIYLNNNNEIKIGDFGLSEYMNSEITISGTPNYIAPEIILQSEIVNKPYVDIWSLGVILYILIYNKAPFIDDSINKIYKRIKNVDYHYPDDNPNPVKNLISKILKFDPKDRPTLEEIKSDPFFD